MELNIADLMHATVGSAALDIATDKPLTLPPKIQCYKKNKKQNWSSWFFAHRDKGRIFVRSVFISQ